MQLVSRDLNDGAPIDPEFAFGRPDPDAHMTLSDNRSPHLAWRGAPDGTESYVLLCVDPDVPADASDANQEGKTIPEDAERMDFFHWVMIDIPPEITELQTGDCSEGVTKGGKKNPPGPAGARQGRNTYTEFMKGAGELEGVYCGYDGPCPPWNDERLHHYHFIVHALDVSRLDVGDDFDGEQVREAMKDHVLATARLTGTYTLNPDLA
ncbi:MAG: YbhB/YbcL family Raf kinase inhibitor-like protein [Wenzhouxiangellaceae bacterium]|nr:YbhB/YbcL family Raf kinase inhibitor-like protein [Wenzhouxiangellaceae bacterium]